MGRQIIVDGDVGYGADLKLAKKHLGIIGVPFPENPVASWIDREEWLIERQLGIGSSEVWKLFTDDPDDRLSLYLDKVGEIEEDGEIAGDLKRGRRAEPWAVEEYEEATGRQIISLPLIRCKDEPLVIDDADGLILPDPGADPGFQNYGAAEVKCPRWHVFSRYKNQGIPERIILQAQHHMLALGLGWCVIIIFDVMGQALLHWTVEADETIHAEIKKRVREFWEEHVGPRMAPTVDDVPVNGVAIDTIEGVAKQRDDEPWLEAAHIFKEAKPIFDEAEARIKVAKAALRKLVAGEYGVHEGGGVRGTFSIRDGNVSWKDTVTKIEDGFPIDREKLKALLESGELRVVFKKGEPPEALKSGDIALFLNTLNLDTTPFRVRGKPVETFRPTIIAGYDD